MLYSLALSILAGQARPLTPEKAGLPPVVGRWDLTIQTKNGPAPGWLEVTHSGYSTLIGRFVGAFGSARPVGQIRYDNGAVSFSLPVQWEKGDADIEFRGDMKSGKLVGRLDGPFFEGAGVVGVRAPALFPREGVRWGKPISLFNGRNLQGWVVRHQDEPNGWVVRNGNLCNDKPAVDIYSRRKFKDFKLHAEFRYPKGSNSGIYLRGRYEVQVMDTYGEPPFETSIGSIYGFLMPRINAARRPGQWQTFDITLVGRSVTVVLNGQEVIDRQEIPGITGEALDSDEGAPGPILIQGNHGQIEFRSIVVRPAL